MLDTLTYAKKLRGVGFTQEQAETQASALYDAVSSLTATKLDVVEAASEVKDAVAREFTDVRRDMANIWHALQATNAQISLLRGMVGFNLALTMAVLAKLLA
ncbi:MAG: hypothetical protein ACYCTF_13270 [Acidiferrobacter sp.]